MKPHFPLVFSFLFMTTIMAQPPNLCREIDGGLVDPVIAPESVIDGRTPLDSSYEWVNFDTIPMVTRYFYAQGRLDSIEDRGTGIKVVRPAPGQVRLPLDTITAPGDYWQYFVSAGRVDSAAGTITVFRPENVTAGYDYSPNGYVRRLWDDTAGLIRIDSVVYGDSTRAAFYWDNGLDSGGGWWEYCVTRNGHCLCFDDSAYSIPDYLHDYAFSNGRLVSVYDVMGAKDYEYFWPGAAPIRGALRPRLARSGVPSYYRLDGRRVKSNPYFSAGAGLKEATRAVGASASSRSTASPAFKASAQPTRGIFYRSRRGGAR